MKKSLNCFLVLLVLATSLFSFFPAVPTVRADHNPTWWDYDWDQRLEYTVNYTLVDEDLVNFPVLIYIDESVVDWGDVQNDLDDIRFTGDYLDELDFEIDSFVLNSEAWFWVRLPEVSSSLDTYFFMYFDNKFCESGENAEAVWDNNFVMVQHMNDETTSTILDSTSYDNDGTKKGANEPIETDGKIAEAQNFDGADDYINVGNSSDLNSNQMTVSFWVTPDDVESSNMAYARDESGKRAYYISIGETTGQLKFACWVGGAFKTVNVAVSAGETYFITCRFNGTRLGVFVNGGTETNGLDASGNIDSTDGDTTIGKRVYATYEGYFEGWIDELEHSNTSRSSAWIKASYYSGALELVYEGYHTGVSYARRGEILAAALVVSLICVPLFILVIFAARRKR